MNICLHQRWWITTRIIYLRNNTDKGIPNSKLLKWLSQGLTCFHSSRWCMLPCLTISSWGMHLPISNKWWWWISLKPLKLRATKCCLIIAIKWDSLSSYLNSNWTCLTSHSTYNRCFRIGISSLLIVAMVSNRIIAIWFSKLIIYPCKPKITWHLVTISGHQCRAMECLLCSNRQATMLVLLLAMITSK